MTTDTVRVAEAFRAAAMSQFGAWCRAHRVEGEEFRRTDSSGKFSSPTLSVKWADGAMRADHGHAHYLPTAEGGDGRRVTHVTVFAEDGFGPGELAALTAVREVKLSAGGDRTNTLRVQLIGLGAREMFRATVPLFGASAVWTSVTPFVAHRHQKQRGAKRDTPALERDGLLSFAELAIRELITLRNLGARAHPLEEVLAVEYGN